MSIHCYSQRLLNPFRGAMNCIRYESAEAVTTDGQHWDIYVTDDELLEGLEGKNILTSEIRYGSWSREQGLKRGPIYPSADFRRLEHLGAIVYEHILKLHDQVPFPFLDHYELWLLDKVQQPLALLDSVVHEKDIDTESAIEWRAGLACHHHFSSTVIRQINEAPAEQSAAEYLTHYINGCTSEVAAAQWFQRDADGQGIGLDGIRLASQHQHRQLDKTQFPDLFLQTRGHDAKHRQLIEELLAWQAPWLLLLPALDKTTRQHYEQLARQQALVVAKQFRLYPEIVDDSVIKAARVEAKLRGPQNDKVDATDSTFYIELADSRTN